ncbi:hypothetical protein FSP39_004787 [Pinctada imbricata]|uniref:Methyltransferase domain-containing protein n=1 Tax=Pinctada imbricata TaxID=66713 RepID=A0AA88YMG4_PINIB|nr:hypothetical protein FSP39_004787 [Pinctada imbricata]
MGCSHRQGFYKRCIRCSLRYVLHSRHSVITALIVTLVIVITLNSVAFSLYMRKEKSILTRNFLGYFANLFIDTSMKDDDVIQFSINTPNNISIKEFYVGHCFNIVNSSDVVIPNEDMLHNMSIDELSCLLQRYVTTLQTFCSEPRRFGKVSYGGVNICMDKEVSPPKGCVIYSYDHHLSKLFPRQMNAHFKCATIFFGKDISTDFFRDVGGFNKILEHHGDDASIIILKMESRDVEPFLKFPEIIDRFAVKQIILEVYFHMKSGNKTKFFEMLAALRKLSDINYYIYWYDINSSYDDREVAKTATTTCFTINMMRAIKSLGNVYLQKSNIPNNISTLGGKLLEKEKLMEHQDIYLNYISKHQIFCKQSVRLGTDLDGGREVCHDVPFRPRSPCIVYSFGKEIDISFEEDVEKTYGCHVYVFNPSINITRYNISRHINVFRFGIGGENGAVEFNNKTVDIKTLKTIQKDLGHTEKRIDVLRIDVRYDEKHALPEMILSGALNNVAQISATFHHYYDVGTLRKLHDIGFRIFRTRQNPQADFYFKNRSFSYVMKVDFLNINLPR